MLENLVSDNFHPYIDETFLLHLNETHRMFITLVSVTDVGKPHATQNRRVQAFSLLFKGSLNLPQQIYRLDHAKLGTLEIFFVPVGQAQDGFLYEAIFN